MAAGILKKRGEKANPREIAASVVESLKDNPVIAELEIAGPGFINISVTPQALTQRAQALAKDDRTGALKIPAQNIMIDYGGANVAKPMHVGHLRSAVIGECLKRLLRFRGEKKTADYPAISPVTMDDLARLYPNASNKAKADPARMERSRLATAELQSGRPGYRALLDHFIAVSIKALKKGYGDLGVEFDLWKGEACVDPLIPDMIEDLKAKGITQEDDGAGDTD